jgi:hypothetical protein
MRYLMVTFMLIFAVPPSNCFAQANPAIAIVTMPSGRIQSDIRHPGTSFAEYDTTTPRYQPLPQGDVGCSTGCILGITEYDYINCKWINQGEWTDPNQTLQPNVNNVAAGVAASTRVFSGTLPSSTPCPGLPVKYLAIDFSWTAHYNQTALTGQVPNAPCSTKNVKGTPVCPTAKFVGEWTTPDNMYDVVYTFTVSVNVVRPIGEMSTFDSFLVASGPPDHGAYGRWQGTLQSNDSEFDFTGERVKEKFVSGTNTCNDRAPGAQGPLNVTPNGKEASWVVGVLTGGGMTLTGNKVPKNTYGWDFVGWSNCAIEAYRCAKATIDFCEATVYQQLLINSPADPANIFDQFGVDTYNNLAERINGFIPPAGNPNSTSFGYFESFRGVAPSKGPAQRLPQYNTNRYSCPDAVIASSKYLRNCIK